MVMTLDADRLERLIRTRRDIHQHAEIAFEEVRTAALIARTAAAPSDSEPTEGVAGTGVTAYVRGNRPGPMLMLRAETDALPIIEETDVPFRSRNVGAMHACGHDAHVAILLTVVELLVESADFPGTVKLVFQPAEETCGGRPGDGRGRRDGWCGAGRHGPRPAPPRSSRRRNGRRV